MSVLLVALAALVAIFFVVVHVFVMPRDKVIGILGSFALMVVVLFPIHLVPNVVRLAELALLSLIVVLAVLRRGTQNITAPVTGLFFTYLAVTFASTAIADIEDAWFQYAMHAVVGVTFLLLGALANPQERRSVAKTIMALAVLQSTYALVEFVIHPPVLWASPVPEAFEWNKSRLANELIAGELRSQGSFGHPLLLALLLVVAAGVALRYDFKHKAPKVSLLILIFTATLTAGSRSATLILLGFMIFSIGSRRFAIIRGTLLTLIVALFAATTSFASGAVDRFFNSGSLTHRQGALDAVPRLLGQDAMQVWIGNGWYSRQYVFDRGLLQLDGFVAIDNQFVALLVTAGIVGVAVFVFILLNTYRRAAEYKLAVLSATAMFLVFDVLDFPATWALLALLMGLASSRSSASQPTLTAPAPAATAPLVAGSARSRLLPAGRGR